MSQHVVIKLIGTAQDGGIPQANCGCVNCQRAYNEPAAGQRNAASLAIILPDEGKWYMIDATPNFGQQIHSVRDCYPNLGTMTGILLTHAHIGHYTGLMFLGREAMSTRNMSIYAGERMQVILRDHVPWKQLVDIGNIELQGLEDKLPFNLEKKLSIKPVLVPHRNEYSETFGFVVSGLHKKVFYLPDIDNWDPWEDFEEIISSVDYSFLDGTFFSKEEIAQKGRDYREIPHPPIPETMDLLQKIVARKNANIYFTHLNHTNPAADPNSEAAATIKSRGFFVADEGMEIEI